MTAREVVVVRGAPDDDEVAALVAALMVVASRPQGTPTVKGAPSWVRDSFTAPGSWSQPR
ncbi:acyl-CoA carboxylase subunit epsilon [Amycolatopsis sp. NPDC051758]|uniref:acyl-CoA carboxylase subunit epsilon n=1 Tax=Amycolatopsis sp. NPDC051758 TaxID=3363935 RepID=UPI0037B8E703